MKRRRTAQEKKLVDDARLLRWWRAFHREEKAVALSGPHARTLAELFRAFANIECVQPTQLVGFVGAINWNGIDHQTRLVVLHELNTAITKFHEKRGLLPIDDRLPGRRRTRSRSSAKFSPSYLHHCRRGRCTRGPYLGANHEG